MKAFPKSPQGRPFGRLPHRPLATALRTHFGLCPWTAKTKLLTLLAESSGPIVNETARILNGGQRRRSGMAARSAHAASGTDTAGRRVVGNRRALRTRQAPYPALARRVNKGRSR